MKQQNEFNSEHEHQHNTAQHLNQNTAQEFATVEELLRHDARQTDVPGGIADRLRKSSADFPRPNRSWWQRLFGQ